MLAILSWRQASFHIIAITWFDPNKLCKYISAFPQVTESKTRRKQCKNLWKTLKVNEEQAKLLVSVQVWRLFGDKGSLYSLRKGSASTELGFL